MLDSISHFVGFTSIAGHVGQEVLGMSKKAVLTCDYGVIGPSYDSYTGCSTRQRIFSPAHFILAPSVQAISMQSMNRDNVSYKGALTRGKNLDALSDYVGKRMQRILRRKLVFRSE